MLAVFALLKSKLAGYLAIVAVVAGVLFGTYRAGQTSTEAEVAKDALREVKTKAEIDAQVARTPVGDLRDELRKWSRK